MPTNRSTPTRRGVLGAALAGGLSLSAGCLTSVPSLGQQVNFGRVDEPPVEEPVYRDWIPADRMDDPGTGIGIQFVHPGNLGRDTIGAANSFWRDIMVTQMDYVGIEFETFDYGISLGSETLAVGAIDHSAVDRTIERTSYQSAGQYESLQLYHREDTDRTIAVGDDVVVSSTHDDARSRIETLYDTGQGTNSRAHEVDDEFALATDRIGSCPSLHLSQGSTNPSNERESLPESQWSAMGFRFDETYVYYVSTYLYPPGEAASQRDLEEFVHDNARATSSLNVDVRTDDRFGVIVMQLSHETYLDQSGGDPSFRSPHITWGVQANSDTITLIHEAGDSVDADVLTVQARAADGEYEPTDEQFTDSFDTVDPGDRLTVDTSMFEGGWIRIWGSVPDSQNAWTELSYDLD